MDSQAQDTSGRAGRLAGFLRNILNGNRKIRGANEAKLLFQAIQAEPVPTSCVERLVASKHGLEALQLSVRLDLGPVFIKSHTLPFINFLADDEVKLLADGQILQKAVLAIAKPPTFWDALVGLAKSASLEGEAIKPFSWLCLELLSLPKAAEFDVHGDIEDVAQDVKFIDSSCPETRRFGYKIQRLLQLLKSPSFKPGASYVPGGRHDNDFDNFRQISIYPTTDEFLNTERPFYRRAQEVFETDMSERAAVHLDNLYRLTREDLLGELRNDWQNTQVRKRGKQAALILGDLRPVGLHLGDDRNRKKCSLAISCGAGLERLKKVHPNSRRKWLGDNRNFLRHQAFGALYQAQEIFGFAFVDRDLDALLSSPPVVILKFTDDKALENALLAFKSARDVMFTLIDTPVFAYEPVLDRLKDMRELPLKDKLLNPAEAVDDFVPNEAMQIFIDRLAENKRRGEVVKIQNGSVTKAFSLDYSQQQSLRNALKSNVSVIQGPPGTGKSFIGALATHYLLQLTKAKILVITYTNHALDQFLKDLLEFGITDDKMVRLGSKSTADTSPLLLSAQRSEYRRAKEAWAVIDGLKEEVKEETEELKESFTRYMQAQPAFEEIQGYLEFSEHGERFFEAFVVSVEEDGYKKVGKKGKEVKPDYLFDRWISGMGPGMFRHNALSQHKNVWDIEPSERGRLLEKWYSAVYQEKAERVREAARRYDHIQDQMDVQFSESKVQLLRNKRIIGCTTTAAAKYSKLISSAGVSVVITEEAGEIQESHTLTALSASVEQLITIGDHEQLRPKTNNYHLTVEKGEGYDLNRSLFERLIRQGHPYTTLQKQHRMHPDISVLVKELTYPELRDGPKTTTRDPIRGLEDRVIFINHDHAEEHDNRLVDRRDQGVKSSKENTHEAGMVLKTVRFLAQQGYRTKDMVVLTPYLGQLRLVRDTLLEEVDPWLSDLDSYELIQAGLMTQAASNVDKSTLRISTIGKLFEYSLCLYPAAERPPGKILCYFGGIADILKTTTRARNQT